MTMEWYKEYYNAKSERMIEFSNKQIDEYMALAMKRNNFWK